MQSDQDLTREVRQTAKKFATRHLEPVVMDVDHLSSGFSSAVFAQGLEAGFDRFVLPEEAGGYGFQMTELCTLVEALSRTCSGHAMVFGIHAALLKVLSEQGGPGADKLLEKVLDSGVAAAVALPEPLIDGSPDLTLRAMKGKGPKTLLTGQVAAVCNVGGGYVIAFARSLKDEPLALVLRAEKETVKLGAPEQALGLRAMPLAGLALEGHPLSRAEVIAEGEQALVFYRAMAAYLCLVSAAAATGVMENARDKAHAYGEERYQGGKMLIGHSHLRIMLGKMGAAVTAAKGAVLYSAMKPGDLLAALGVKQSVTGDAMKVCTDAVQILGGYGYMREFGLEKAMRDAAVLALLPFSNARAELMITSCRS